MATPSPIFSMTRARRAANSSGGKISDPRNTGCAASVVSVAARMRGTDLFSTVSPVLGTGLGQKHERREQFYSVRRIAPGVPNRDLSPKPLKLWKRDPSPYLITIFPAIALLNAGTSVFSSLSTPVRALASSDSRSASQVIAAAVGRYSAPP